LKGWIPNQTAKNHWNSWIWTITLADSSAAEDGVVAQEGRGDGPLIVVPKTFGTFGLLSTDNWLPKFTAISNEPPLRRDGVAGEGRLFKLIGGNAGTLLQLLSLPPPSPRSPSVSLPTIALFVSTLANGLDDEMLLSLGRSFLLPLTCTYIHYQSFTTTAW